MLVAGNLKTNLFLIGVFLFLCVYTHIRNALHLNQTRKIFLFPVLYLQSFSKTFLGILALRQMQ